MVEVAFFVGAIGALGGAIAVVLLRNPFYSVLALVIHLVFLAGIFLLLRAQFLAAAQIVVYAGAVMVIYVFVAAYVGGIEEARFDAAPQLKVIGPILALALFVEISIAVLGSSLSELGKEGADVAAGFGTPEAVGKLMIQDFLIAFEAASLLLMLAAVAAIILAGKKKQPTKGPVG